MQVTRAQPLFINPELFLTFEILYHIAISSQESSDNHPLSLQEVSVKEFLTSCNRGDKGLLRLTESHLEICDGKSWVRLLNDKVSLNSNDDPGQHLLYITSYLTCPRGINIVLKYAL